MNVLLSLCMKMEYLSTIHRPSYFCSSFEKSLENTFSIEIVATIKLEKYNLSSCIIQKFKVSEVIICSLYLRFKWAGKPISSNLINKQLKVGSSQDLFFLLYHPCLSPLSQLLLLFSGKGRRNWWGKSAEWSRRQSCSGALVLLRGVGGRGVK